MHTAWVAGVDGCRSGWAAVLIPVRSKAAPRVLLLRKFSDLLTCSLQPVVIAVDIPIGLLDRPQAGGRPCDQEARRLLGPRRSSIFSPPARSQFDGRSGMSRQTLGILRKVRELDRVMTPALQRVVHEAHPELAFLALTGRPMPFNKKTGAGRKERLAALRNKTDGIFQDLDRALRRARQTDLLRGAAFDDVLDAAVLSWTARRIYSRTALRIPSEPDSDRRGLRMEIWY